MQVLPTGGRYELILPRSRPALSPAPESCAPLESGRAITPIGPIPTRSGWHGDYHPSVSFLAHLIAVDRRLPQTLMRGRAEPADAAATYAATLARAPTCAGQKLHRSI